MAEAAVGFVVDKLISYLAEETNLVGGFHRDVTEITDDLRYIRAFLKDAYQRVEAEADGDSYTGVKLLVEDLQEAVLAIGDVIDEYTHFMAQQQDDDHDRPTKRRFIGNILNGVSRSIQNLKTRRGISSKIQELRQRVREITERGQRFGFISTQQEPSSRNNTWCDPRNDARFLKETEVIGIQADRDELFARLVRGSSNKQTVISLVGMPGIGKTTLANQVFVRAKARFDCHAWINVSQSYNKLELTRSLIRKFCRSRDENAMSGIGEEMDHNALAMNLRDYLQGKSYFVVFDDVWDTNFWDNVKNGLRGEKGRILITTRNVEVAKFCQKSLLVHIHQMQLLNSRSSWELFCITAFRSEAVKNCPSHLEAYSREIVKRCKGLPLVIVVIAGLLATKNQIANEWIKMLTSLSYELESNEHLSINRILSLSYHDLPANLQSCFLYFGIFPEDYSISSHLLVRLWIAEGLVKPQNGKTVEVVGEEYLVELMNRSIIQASKIDFDGRGRCFRVQDLVREFVLKKLDDLRRNRVEFVVI